MSSMSASLEPLDAVGSDLVSYTARPNFRALGRRFGKDTPLVAAAIHAADPAALATALGPAGAAEVAVAGVTGAEPGGLVRLSPEDVTITQTPRAGWAVRPATARRSHWPPLSPPSCAARAWPGSSSG